MRIALSFLTRLPVGRLEVEDYLAELGRSSWLFPLVGLVVGLVTLVAGGLAGLLFGPALRALAVIAAGLWVTGLLHLDGLMDTVDAIGSNRSRERMLEIMKDSRVGAMGATAGALSLLLRFALLLEIPGGLLPVAVLVAPALGRMSITLTAGLWPPARVEGGLGRLFASQVGRRQVAGALLLGLGIALAVPLALQATGAASLLPAVLRSLTACAAAPLSALALARSLAATLGGLTGDTYGTVSELAEVAALACFAALQGA